MVFTILQWIGAILGVAGSFLVTSPRSEIRRIGFTVWVFSNAAIVAWHIHTGAYGLIVMQMFYTVSSLLGIYTNRAMNKKITGKIIK